MKRETPPNLKLLHEILTKLQQLDKQIKSLNQDVKEIKHYVEKPIIIKKKNLIFMKVPIIYKFQIRKSIVYRGKL